MQELIGRKLTYKKEIDNIKDQNEQFQREIVRLQAQSRIHRADKDLKINELAATVRTLSVRGDMHAQAAAARQEVEAEKLTNYHLRADVDSYRNMLEEEQRKVLMGRKELANLQSQIDSSLVLQSVVNIPGVSPATLIELMAGQITQLESEVTKSRASTVEVTNQLRTLQRTLQQAQQRRQAQVEGDVGSSAVAPNVAGANVATAGSASSARKGLGVAASSPTPQRSRSLSPTTGRRASTGGVRGLDNHLRHSVSGASMHSGTSMRPFEDDFGDILNQSIDDDDAFAQSPLRSSAHLGETNYGNIAIVVDGEATPKMVVDSLDRAVLAQRLVSQEATIQELNALVDDLKAQVMQADREQLIASDVTDETDRIEWERSLRKQDLLQTLLDESRSEVKKLQQRTLELEKSLSDVHASHMLDGYNKPYGADEHRHSQQHKGQDSLYFEDAPMLGNHTSDMSNYSGMEINYEENKKELESTKILLRERTTQLKVIMETLDSLQIAGVKSNSKFNAEDEYLFNKRPGSADSSNLSGAVRVLVTAFVVPPPWA